MKFLRLASDIHLDGYADAFLHMKYPIKNGVRMTEVDALWYPEPMDGDDDTCFILAGDIWMSNRAFEPRYGGDPKDMWLARLARQFKCVVLVLGNHDYWGESIQRAPVKAAAHGVPNVHVLERSSVVVDQVKFVGGTLWTDYNNGDSRILGSMKEIMVADHTRIRYATRDGVRRLKTSDLFSLHRETRRYIANNAKRDEPEQKVVVVTHMAPTYQSVSPLYRKVSEEVANFAYFSHLDNFIFQNQSNIDFWMHGHMHLPSDYEVGRTRVICNPRGYYSEPNFFNPTFRIELT